MAARLLDLSGASGGVARSPEDQRPFIFPVWCDGFLHFVYLRESGELVLHDHPEGVATLRVAAAHGDAPACLSAFDWLRYALKDKNSWGSAPGVLGTDATSGRLLPWSSRHAAERDLSKKQREWRERQARPGMFSFKMAAKWSDVARGLLVNTGPDRRTSYKLFESGLPAVREGLTVQMGAGPMVNCVLRGRNAVDLSLSLPWRWVRLHRMGLSVVDRSLVLDVVEADSPYNWLVLAMRQGRGRNVELAQAWMRRSDYGSPWTLTWCRGRG